MFKTYLALPTFAIVLQGCSDARRAGPGTPGVTAILNARAIAITADETKSLSFLPGAVLFHGDHPRVHDLAVGRVLVVAAPEAPRLERITEIQERDGKLILSVEPALALTDAFDYLDVRIPNLGASPYQGAVHSALSEAHSIGLKLGGTSMKLGAGTGVDVTTNVSLDADIAVERLEILIVDGRLQRFSVGAHAQLAATIAADADTHDVRTLSTEHDVVPSGARLGPSIVIPLPPLGIPLVIDIKPMLVAGLKLEGREATGHARFAARGGFSATAEFEREHWSGTGDPSFSITAEAEPVVNVADGKLQAFIMPGAQLRPYGLPLGPYLAARLYGEIGLDRSAHEPEHYVDAGVSGHVGGKAEVFGASGGVDLKVVDWSVRLWSEAASTRDAGAASPPYDAGAGSGGFPIIDAAAETSARGEAGTDGPTRVGGQGGPGGFGGTAGFAGYTSGGSSGTGGVSGSGGSGGCRDGTCSPVGSHKTCSNGGTAICRCVSGYSAWAPCSGGSGGAGGTDGRGGTNGSGGGSSAGSGGTGGSGGCSYGTCSPLGATKNCADGTTSTCSCISGHSIWGPCG